MLIAFLQNRDKDNQCYSNGSPLSSIASFSLRGLILRYLPVDAAVSEIFTLHYNWDWE